MTRAGPIELLSPAKDLECGIEAIRHGADAVYIGSPKFGARSAVGNKVDDIRKLCDFAHIFNAKVYIAFNTILFDNELQEAEDLIHQLFNVGADSLIIQDMGITQLNLPPIPLHVSTQADNCTTEKIVFWQQMGFRQAVLARELSLDEIETIARQTSIRLEAFVHGALCVSYSGRCYISAAMCGRSANRGECAQFCRLPYTMIDANGKTIVANKHLLSLNDLNLTDELEAMMQAGISSFKIEGRLKNVTYVKNLTAYYRMKLDEVFAKNPLFYRSSSGTSSYTFTPHPEKSFNRGFTSYFLYGRQPDITSFDTPKSIGEQVGTVKELKGNSFIITGRQQVNNGDGLIFINVRGDLEGFRVNRVEGNQIFPLKIPAGLRPKTVIYRNYDKSFEDMLSKPSSERKLPVKMELSESDLGFVLSITDENGVHAVITKSYLKEKAMRNQTDHIRSQLAKLGNTPFRADEIVINLREPRFIPLSILGTMRREAVDKLIQTRRNNVLRELVMKNNYANSSIEYPSKHLDYTTNIANQNARSFYRLHGVETMEDAFEINPQHKAPLMFTKHCLRYSMGWCPGHHTRKSPFQEPFFLIHKQIKLQLKFDCEKCMMQITELDVMGKN
ncbi:MAG: U32 family peptidase [Tannerella sp.]|jgi:putative protease|nr:U32 family peptidase [Tannerella sp.]